MSHFAAHGYYRISWHGDVIKVIVGDLFNREGVEQLVAEIDQAVAQGARTGWGLLLDARQWQGGTPEAPAAACRRQGVLTLRGSA